MLSRMVRLCAASSLLFAVGVRADAKSCDLVARGRTLFLRSDCELRSTLVIPDGYTLDGLGHTLTARNPEGGSFSGAVVQNGGAVANIRNVVIEARDLIGPCHQSSPVDLRVRGIFFLGASGSIVNNRIAIDQGESGCAEAAAIEVRTLRDDDREEHVLIASNRIERFQKTGIFVQGPIDVDITLNHVEGQGPVSYLVQTGILLREQVAGSVQGNHVYSMQYVPSDYATSGISLVDGSGPLTVAHNRIEQADVGIRLTAIQDAQLVHNHISEPTYDGISLDGRDSEVSDNRVQYNLIYEAVVGIDLFGGGATHNLVAHNVIVASADVALQEVMGAGDNLVLKNLALDSAHK